MKVTLFRDMKDENWPSMEVYADGLAAALQRGDFPELLLRQFTVSSLRPHPWGTYFSRILVYPRRARRAQGEVNHVIDHSYGHLLHLLAPTKTVVTCHDLYPMVRRDLFPQRSPAVMFWNQAFKGTLKAARIIAGSQATRKDLLAHSNYPASRVSVVYYGVDKAFRPVPDVSLLDPVRNRLRLGPGPFLLHVGHCGARKNIEGILRALYLLTRRRGQGLRFLQVGGQFDAGQRELLQRLGLEDMVTQIRRVDFPDLVALYNLASVLVFPSYYEGFGLPVLEAMACGLPVVCANAASLPEVAGDAALMVDPDDDEGLAEALERALDDGELREALKANGLERARRFTWEECAAKTYAVYRDLYEELYG